MGLRFSPGVFVLVQGVFVLVQGVFVLVHGVLGLRFSFLGLRLGLRFRNTPPTQEQTHANPRTSPMIQ